jgi:hypothetical protein
MKITYLLSLVLFLISCKITDESKNIKTETYDLFTFIFSDLSLAKYKTNNLIYLNLGNYKTLKNEILKISEIKIIEDCYSKKKKKFLRIEEFYQSSNFLRIQISCYDKTKPYILMYSTSFERINNKMVLIESVSPYIDTIYLKSNRININY